VYKPVTLNVCDLSVSTRDESTHKFSLFTGDFYVSFNYATVVAAGKNEIFVCPFAQRLVPRWAFAVLIPQRAAH
jgi:hypothetical protein